MNLHFPLPKIRTFRFSLHTSRLSLHGEVTMVALKFAMSSHFPLPKIFSPSGFVPPLSNGTSRATSDRKPKTNDQILPSPILFFPSKKWIKLIPKTIGNRKRDCAWGGSGWSTLPEKIYMIAPRHFVLKAFLQCTADSYCRTQANLHGDSHAFRWASWSGQGSIRTEPSHLCESRLLTVWSNSFAFVCSPSISNRTWLAWRFKNAPKDIMLIECW